MRAMHSCTIIHYEVLGDLQSQVMIAPPRGYKLLRAGISKETDWSAILGAPSGCWMDTYGRRRILLWRTFDESPELAPLAFGMMNPSIATHEEVDNTVRRTIGYAKRERAGGTIVVNRSPYIATDQDYLERQFRGGIDVFTHEANRVAWQVAAALSSKLIAAWGTPRGSWWREASKYEKELLAPFAGNVFSIGPVAKSGEPKHPLYLKSDAPLLHFL